ncbi:hypothetical protein Poli38472_011778 [Pythium oligandrum]|uniref:Calcineurin-like phosphoesterase domain-containing protein n=1 Tax=Pythium oligandrum TaxID=41045 RepID=A0A8K1C8F5_PYTOL|nr:hypothetical protein Poli38472_011778 [Pythium oligandrum]|eukprot:TMW58190.1 hypothetical protein Poli38472_011778 [Pythium oligandrum]
MRLLNRGLAILALVLSEAHASSHFAVTNVYLPTFVKTSDAAIEECHQSYKTTAVGADWGYIDGSIVAHLCQRRQPLEEMKPTQLVLQKIAVYGATECPPNMELLHRPKYYRVVCIQWESASVALSSGNYITDIWVSTQRNYNNDDLGWTSLHLSVSAPGTSMLERMKKWLWTPIYRGAFISYQRPVLPIRDVQVLQRNGTTILTSFCSTAFGGEWEDTSESYPIRSRDDVGRTLCVRRSNSTSEPALLAVRVTEYAESCLGLYNQTEALDNGMYLCMMYGNPDARVAPLVSMHIESRMDCTDAEKSLPGGLGLVTTMSLNHPTSQSQAACLYAARLNTPTVPISNKINRPPLVANEVTASNDTMKKLTFKVLQLADLHLTGDPTTRCRDAPKQFGSPRCSEALTTEYVNKLLDLEKPDFVAFSGDNVQTFDRSLRQAAMDAATGGVEAREIPYAMVFGNHDDENGFSREELMNMAKGKPHSYSQRGPVEVYGVGNYELSVQAPVGGAWGDAQSDVFRMYFLDSNAYPDHKKLSRANTKYDWIRPSQVAYYRQMSAAHNSTVPSIMFFHIPLPEYAMDAKSLRLGLRRESVTASEVHSNLFATLVELDEVKATFAGHDHVNEYCYKRESVQLCYGGGTGFGVAYGWKEGQRRARVIEWTVDSANKREIRSWKVLYGQIQQRVDEQVLYRG